MMMMVVGVIGVWVIWGWGRYGMHSEGLYMWVLGGRVGMPEKCSCKLWDFVSVKWVSGMPTCTSLSPLPWHCVCVWPAPHIQRRRHSRLCYVLDFCRVSPALTKLRWQLETTTSLLLSVYDSNIGWLYLLISDSHAAGYSVFSIFVAFPSLTQAIFSGHVIHSSIVISLAGLPGVGVKVYCLKIVTGISKHFAIAQVLDILWNLDTNNGNIVRGGTKPLNWERVKYNTNCVRNHEDNPTRTYIC